MGFFADIIAGGVGGLGQGMSNVARQQGIEEEQARVRAERAALAESLQSQKSDDLRYKTDENAALRLQLAEMRGGGSGGGTGSRGGKGGSSSWVEEGLQTAKTPEEIDKFMRLVQLRAPDALPAVAQYFGKPMQEDVMSVPKGGGFDAAVDRSPDSRDETIPQAIKTGSRTKVYDSARSAAVLNDLIAKAKATSYDDYAKGARGFNLDDMAGKAASVESDPELAATKYQALSNPTVTADTNNAKREVAETRADATTTAAATRAAKGSGGKAPDPAKTDAANEKLLATAVKNAAARVAKLNVVDQLDPAKVSAHEAKVASAIANDEQVKALNIKLGRPAPAAATPPASNRLSQFKVIR